MVSMISQRSSANGIAASRWPAAAEQLSVRCTWRQFAQLCIKVFVDWKCTIINRHAVDAAFRMKSIHCMCTMYSAARCCFHMYSTYSMYACMCWRA